MTRLTDTIGQRYESAFIIKRESFIKLLKKSCIYQKGDDGSSSPSFPMITMDCNDVLFVFFDIVVHFSSNLKQSRQRRRKMVSPLIFQNVIVKIFIIVFARTDINNEIVISVFLLQILRDVFYRIPVYFL